jgi:GDPmannose 4,6-dehydratase
MLNRTCIITGAGGQVFSYLAEVLLDNGFTVVGTRRRCSNHNNENLKHLIGRERFSIDEMELCDYSSVRECITRHNPEQIYNLAAMSFVGSSFSQPKYCFEVNTIGVLNILEVIRQYLPESKFYNSSTSEMFGTNYDSRTLSDGTIERYQDENTKFVPASPYGISKLASHNLVKLYRDAYGIKCCSGILFNMESKFRGLEFVTRKITSYIAELVKNCSIRHTGYGMQSADRVDFIDIGMNNGFSFIPDDLKNYQKLALGNINSFRDWNHAKDSSVAQFLMLQQCGKMQDYVISSGTTRSVKDFLHIAFSIVGLDYRDFIRIDKKYYRPSDVEYLCGDSTKARTELKWSPKITFDELVREMVFADIDRVI